MVVHSSWRIGLILIAVLVAIGWLILDGQDGDGPQLQAADNAFASRDYAEAARLYRQISRHWRGKMGLANAQVQLGRFEPALVSINGAIALAPDNDCLYANRGVVHDHLGRYDAAIADYRRAVSHCPESTKGMHWLDRLMYNVQKRPPTVLERLGYLNAQMKLPANERQLSLPKLDRMQRPEQR